MELHIQQIAGGGLHSLVLLSDGSIWATGDNYNAQLGHGIYDARFGWIPVMTADSGVIQIAAGGMHSLALKSDGSVWATGTNDHATLGNGADEDQSTWVCVMPEGSRVIQLAAGGGHSLALKSDGSVWGAGFNKDGQLGDGTHDDRFGWGPVMASGSGVIQLVAGRSHSLALKSDGSVWVTGYNEYGRLGDGTTWHKPTWVSVIESGITQVAGGGSHSLALKSDGSVWVTGYNEYGQLGDGTETDKTTWTCVIPSGVTQVAAGFRHSFALKADGAVWATGDNSYGQMGDGTRARCNSWKSVIPSGATQVTAGFAHSFALKADGAFLAAGRNDRGQLGREGAGSTVWMQDRFFERLLLESFLIDPPRSRRTLSETDSTPDTMPDAADDWPGLSL